MPPIRHLTSYFQSGWVFHSRKQVLCLGIKQYSQRLVQPHSSAQHYSPSQRPKLKHPRATDSMQQQASAKNQSFQHNNSLTAELSDLIATASHRLASHPTATSSHRGMVAQTTVQMLHNPTPSWARYRPTTEQPGGEQHDISAGITAEPKTGYSDPSIVVDWERGDVFNFHVKSFDAGYFTSQPGTDPDDRNVAHVASNP